MIPITIPHSCAESPAGIKLARRAAGFAFVALVLGAMLMPVPAFCALRIMPLGDSITAGSYGAGQDGIGGYRRFLWQSCQDAKLSVNFVGTLNDPTNATFDADHEGHRAWRTDNLAGNVTDWLNRCRPDCVLLQIGVNDLIQGATPETAAQRFNVLLDRCQQAAPQATFYVAAILKVRSPNDYKVKPATVEAYNSLIPAIVARHGTNFVFVDLPGLCNFVTGDFSADGLHPSDSGYQKMGAAWFTIVKPRLAGLKETPANLETNPDTNAAITPYKELSKNMLFGTEVDPNALGRDPSYTALLTNHYNIVVPENDLKFQDTERSRGRFTFEKADKVVQFAQEHNLVVRGHVLVYQWQSEWLRNNYVDQYDNAPEGKFAAKDVKAILDHHIETVMGRYKGRIKYWDVVNEVICDPVGTNNVDRSSMDTILQHSFWYKAFKILQAHGDVSEDFVSYAFRKAHSVDPDCKLFLNDYGIEGYYGWGEKSFAARALVKSLLDHGVPIHGVGLQMHQNYGNDPSAGDNLDKNIQAYKDMGLEVQVTECDIKIELPVLSTSPDKVYGEPTPADLANQARTYYNIVKTCKESGNVTAFLTWGFTDRYSWIPWKYPGWGWALPFDKNYQPKPAAYAIEKALKGEPLP